MSKPQMPENRRRWCRLTQTYGTSDKAYEIKVDVYENDATAPFGAKPGGPTRYVVTAEWGRRVSANWPQQAQTKYDGGDRYKADSVYDTLQDEKRRGGYAVEWDLLREVGPVGSLPKKPTGLDAACVFCGEPKGSHIGPGGVTPCQAYEDWLAKAAPTPRPAKPKPAPPPAPPKPRSRFGGIEF